MKSKRTLGILLTITMIIGTMSAFTLTVNAATACATEGCTGSYTNGFCSVDSTHYEPAQVVSSTHHSELNSTHSGYYAIENAGQLYWFAGLVNGTLTNTTQNGSANAVLTNDIIVNSNVLNADGSVKSGDFIDWTPIGNNTYKFSGSFDGNNHTISGLYADVYASVSAATNENKYVGVFGYANKATAKNLTVKDSFFAGYEWVGGIAGYFWNYGSLMENCVSYATVKGVTKVGGVAGGIQYGKATNCHNHGLVIGSNMTGGFTGKTGYSTVFTNCSNTGTVRWILGSSGYFGGFVADASSGTSATRAKFINCFNSGDIIYDSNASMTKQIGGFVCLAKGTYENCYSSGSITINQSLTGYQIGGFAASEYSDLTITNCYYDNTKISYDALNDADRDGVTGKSTTAFTSGEVAYLLQGQQGTEVWGQTIGVDTYPILDGRKVYFANDVYYNEFTEFEILSNGTDGTKATATVAIPTAGTYTLIFADYEETRLNNMDFVTITTKSDNTVITVPSEIDITLGAGDKIMLWQNMTTHTPLCEAYIVK